jgi:ribosome-binding protein aMBF1 (putative translation factor)
MMRRSPANKRQDQKLTWDSRYVGTRVSCARLPSKVNREPCVHKEDSEGESYGHQPLVANGRWQRSLHKERGISVRELAESSGLSTSVIYRLEKNRLRESGTETHTLER